LTSERDGVVERELRIAARPEIVFEYFVDPERLALWMGSATVDVQPGGALQVAVAGIHRVSGEYLEVDPPRRVVFTWGWIDPAYGILPGGSRVEIDLRPVGDETVLRLRHYGLESEYVEAHGEGWMHYLRRLAVAAAGGDPGPDPMAPEAEATPSTTNA
jgi:uncharacterized protein YndB with AHSA1/START domain